MIRGPLKVYDSTPALVAALFAEREGFFRELCDAVFPRFFEHRLEIDQSSAVAALIDELGYSGAAYLDFAAGQGAQLFERCQQEAADDHVFGVPLFVLCGEQFWGQDRLPLLEERLTQAGLLRETQEERADDHQR